MDENDINRIVVQKQMETINEGKNLLLWSVIWWGICLLISVVGLFLNGWSFSTYIMIAICILLVRIGNMLCEISVNIRTTIRQNDDIRLLMSSKK